MAALLGVRMPYRILAERSDSQAHAENCHVLKEVLATGVGI